MGAVGLAVLDAVLSRPGAASNVGGWELSASKLVAAFISPTVPAFATGSVAPTGTADAAPATTSSATTTPAVTTYPVIAPTTTTPTVFV